MNMYTIIVADVIVDVVYDPQSSSSPCLRQMIHVFTLVCLALLTGSASARSTRITRHYAGE